MESLASRRIVKRRDEVWIGLAEVRQRPGASVLMDRNEAFTNVLALADSGTGFTEAVRRALDQMGFDLVELEDPEPLRQRQQKFTVADELLSLAQCVKASGRTAFGTWHTWTSDSEPDA